MSSTITEEQIECIIAAARAMVGKVPWRHQGRSTRGVDCIGLFKLSAQTVGLDIQMPANYTRSPEPSGLEAGMRQHCTRIMKKDAIPGDLALIKYGDRAVHLVMFTNVGIIHCSADAGQVVEHCINEKWRNDIVSVWRVKGRFCG